MGTKMVSVRLDDELLAWLDGYAESRGSTRTQMLETAVASFQEDAASGVPELRDRVRAMRAREALGNGECVCPVFEDGRRGFRQRCPVHGGKSREDFAAATAERAALFARLKAPASSHGMKKAPK